jgi:hypothetical protein
MARLHKGRYYGAGMRESNLLGPVSVPRTGLVIAALPGIVMLTLFYSLAVHMYHALGGWPASIGERGFPQALIIHSTVAISVFVVLVLSLFLSPVAFVACLIVERWHSFAVYCVVYAVSVVVSLVLTQVAAPAQFLYWWRD